MAVQQFHLLGDPVSSARNIELDEKANVNDVKDLIASHFAIVSPNGEPEHYLSQIYESSVCFAVIFFTNNINTG